MDFESKVQNDGYKNPVPYSRENREAYRQAENKLVAEFTKDHIEWLKAQGVPARYAAKVAAKAWEDGHSSGFSEVLNVSYSLVEIFR